MAQLLHFSQFRPPVSACLRPKAAAYRDLPARDRVIDFGKHKGRMLGSLPSPYLKWISKNLRARDFEEWTRLADEVLADPVYRDRLEWEAAERVLGGGAARLRGSETPVSDLIDISKRFGWDNEDKDAWARLDFNLLGTSKGGQIPRLQKPGKEANFDSVIANPTISNHSKPTLSGTSMASSMRSRWAEKEGKDGILNANVTSWSNLRLNQTAKPKQEETFGSDSKTSSKKSISHGGKIGFFSKGQRYIVGEEEMVDKCSRVERREMMRWKREQQMEKLREEVGVQVKKKSEKDEQLSRKKIVNPFPGRKALLDKIKETKRSTQ